MRPEPHRGHHDPRGAPDDSILGEEGGSRPGTTAVQWLVDPLDGTANVVYGRADHAVYVGARVGGVPVAGAIVRPGHRQWVMGRAPSPAATVSRVDRWPCRVGQKPSCRDPCPHNPAHRATCPRISSPTE